jgi:hypothetical protein
MSSLSMIGGLFGQRAFYRRQGTIVSEWAALEFCIDEANNVAWHDSGRTLAREVPVNFKWKVKFFRKAHKELPLLRPLRERGEAIIVRLERLLDDRHNLVHGFLLQEGSGFRSWLIQRNVFTPDDGILWTEKRYTRRDLDLIIHELRDLTVETVDYLDAFLTAIRMQKEQNARGKGAS